MTGSGVNKAQQTTDLVYKAAKQQGEIQAKTTKAADLEGDSEELGAVLAHLGKLKLYCGEARVSCDGRVTQRKEEIETQQESRRLHNGEDLERERSAHGARGRGTNSRHARSRAHEQLHH